MAMNTRLVDNYKFVWAAKPQSYSSTAMTAQWVSLKNYNHLTILIQTGAWAAGTAAVTLSQATTVTGTSSKALAFTKVWINTAALADTWVETAVVSNTFNLDTASLGYIIEVDAATMDIDNDFDCCTLAVASPGANADFYGVWYALSGTRFIGAQANMPTALAN